MTTPKRKLDKSDRATILAALRMFQAEYAGHDAEQILEDWQEYFADVRAQEFIKPLSMEDIDTLCEEINEGKVEF